MTIERKKVDFIVHGKGVDGLGAEQKNITHWKCGSCDFTFTAPTPPKECPECKEKCDFKNITCYTPDCGGPGNVDSRL